MTRYTSPSSELDDIGQRIQEALEQEGIEAQRALASALVKIAKESGGQVSITQILEESDFALDELDE